jgi:hypothetical protein
MVIDVLKYMTNMSNRKSGMRKGGALRQKSQKSVSNRNMITHPVQLGNYLLTHKVRLRFIATAAFSTVFTYQNLLDLILSASSATVGYDVFHRVRVRGVEMWSIAALGSSTSVSCQFNGSGTGISGDGKFHTDTSMGIEPAHIFVRPVVDSLPDLYQASSSNAVMTLEGGAGTVIDLLLSFQQVDGIATEAQNALVGATTGVLYWRGLDGSAISGSNFIPPSNLHTI